MEKVFCEERPQVISVMELRYGTHTTYNVGCAECEGGYECYSIAFAADHSFGDVAKAVHDCGAVLSVEEWREIVAHLNAMSYDAIVAGLINARYSEDAMQAIVNNRLLLLDEDEGMRTFAGEEPERRSEIDDEYFEMQKFRKECKELAREIVRATIRDNLKKRA